MRSEKSIKHIAFIMDGNGRWAKERHLPRNNGHKEGVKTMMRIARSCFEFGIPYVSFYAFSTENRRRPPAEVRGLIGIMRDSFDRIAAEFVESRVRLNVMGDITYFGDDLCAKIGDVVARTANFEDRVANIALNYGGRDELERAFRLRAQSGDNAPIGDFLYTAGQPDPDLLVRTGGEKRLSNFMLYQLAYTELFFSDTYWPDFSEEELSGIIDEYSKRDRRFGK